MRPASHCHTLRPGFSPMENALLENESSHRQFDSISAAEPRRRPAVPTTCPDAQPGRARARVRAWGQHTWHEKAARSGPRAHGVLAVTSSNTAEPDSSHERCTWGGEPFGRERRSTSAAPDSPRLNADEMERSQQNDPSPTVRRAVIISRPAGAGRMVGWPVRPLLRK